MTPDEDYARRLTFFQGQREANQRRKEEIAAELRNQPLSVRVAVKVCAAIYVLCVWLFDREIWRLRCEILKWTWRNWRLERQIKRNERKLCTHKQPTS